MKYVLCGILIGSAAIAIYYRNIPHDTLYAILNPRYTPKSPAGTSTGRTWDVYVCPKCGQRWATRSAAETCTEQGCR